MSFQKIIPYTISADTDFSDVSQHLINKHPDVLGDLEELVIERELVRWALKWKAVPGDKIPRTTLEALNISAGKFPNVKKLSTVLSTLPVSTAEPKRIFSKVNLTKSTIRASDH